MARLDETSSKWWAQVCASIPRAAEVVDVSQLRQFLVEYNAIAEKYLGPGVKLGAWHLQIIGVKRACHKRGVGTALITFAEKLVSLGARWLVGCTWVSDHAL